jgi:hypothetical protein
MRRLSLGTMLGVLFTTAAAAFTAQQIVDGACNNSNLPSWMNPQTAAAVCELESGCNPFQANTSGSPSHNGLYQMGPGELKEGGWNGTWQELAQQPLSKQLEVWGRYLQNRDRTTSWLDPYMGQTIGGVKIDAAFRASCIQLGSGNGGICKNFVLNGGVCNSSTRDNNGAGTCMRDYAKTVQAKANKDAALASNCGQTQNGSNDCPAPTDASGGMLASSPSPGANGSLPSPSTSAPPAVASTDVVVSSTQI